MARTLSALAALIVAGYHPNGTLDDTTDSDPGVDFGGDGIAVIDAGGGARTGWTSPDGSTDSSFGPDGLQTREIATATDGRDRLEAILQQSDGKLLLAGTSNMSDEFGGEAFSFARYNADGTRDDGIADSNADDQFGTDGTVTTKLTTGVDGANALAQQPDGKLVAVGEAGGGGGPGGDFAVVRLNEDGTLDTGFSDDGKQTTAGAPGEQGERALAVTVQPDGKLAVSGSAIGGGWPVLRYTAAGLLDPTFDLDGQLRIGAEGNAVAIAAVDGRLVVAGTRRRPPGDLDDLAAARLHQDDVDADGAAGGADNCLDLANPGQENLDGDGQGDLCDGDDDGDGVADGGDACPAEAGTGTDGCPAPVIPPLPPGPVPPGPTSLAPPLPPPPPADVPTNGDDVLNGTAGADTICGLLGDDTINGLGGDDTLFGDRCGDVLRLQAAPDGDDLLLGGDGNDRLVGAGGDDRLSGGRGRDALLGGAGRNSYRGGPGNDRISARNRRRETVNCGSGRRDRATVDRVDRVRGCERVARRR